MISLVILHRPELKCALVASKHFLSMFILFTFVSHLFAGEFTTTSITDGDALRTNV
jgi:hypothetical protein